MKQTKVFMIISLFIVLSMACNFLGNATNAEKTDPPNSDLNNNNLPSSASSNGFSAEFVDGDVSLKWEPLINADKYLLEFKAGDNYYQIATLPEDQNSFVDGNVPWDTV